MTLESIAAIGASNVIIATENTRRCLVAVRDHGQKAQLAQLSEGTGGPLPLRQEQNSRR